ncbi:MAG: hypothetical protein HQM16_15975 [Deltaproteobacteria bacterium]|nr:hypothetical protein [Deltaproteobacteria bacterium]
MGNINTKNDLFDPRQSSGATLAHYPQGRVLDRLREFHGWSSGRAIKTFLGHDYQTDDGRWRTMSQHGGDRDFWGSDASLNFTYSSHTQMSHDDRHFYGMMLGAANQGPDVIAWRDLAFVAMVPGGRQMVTGASGVAVTMAELSDYVYQQTGVLPRDLNELSAYLYALNYGAPVGDVVVEPGFDGSLKAKNRLNDREGRLFVHDRIHQSGLVLVVASNVQVNDTQQRRRLFSPGVVPTGPRFTPLIAGDTGQARDGNRDIERLIGEGGIHDFYSGANTFVRRATGMDYQMV